ncbi:helix-turn-helix domain-containing protein [Aggregatibacter actinomycetemcomitans]|uniref:helix-turn-helix domain-containing protein n=1 Tax=Aggregatibacter actinomycetemcomitans TaxID=714 RepID=UPI001E4977DE|nr:helix-turn-helix domain-containing protein [Aggregatibacter actinomycetemcomitans]
MKNFTDIVNRLKTELSVSMDKDIAEFLGMSKSAFAERKRRGVFPKEALMLADLKHSELKLNVEYILTGRKGDELSQLLTSTSKKRIDHPLDPEDISIEEQPITPKDADAYVLVNMEEKILLNWYRRSDTKGKKLILDIAKMSPEMLLTQMRLVEYTEKKLFNNTERGKR